MRRYNDESSGKPSDAFERAHKAESRGVGLYGINRMEPALEAFNAAVELFEVALQESDDDEIEYRLASALNNRGSAQHSLGNHEQTKESYLRALEILARLWNKRRHSLDIGRDLAATLSNIGYWLSEFDDTGPAEELLLASLRVRESVLRDHPSDERLFEGLVKTTANLSHLHESHGFKHELDLRNEWTKLIPGSSPTPDSVENPLVARQMKVELEPEARPAEFTTDPSYHVDLLQMVASVVIASGDHALAHKEIPRRFGIELVEEVPRWFAGGTEARAFLFAFSKHGRLAGDFGWNPLYGRRDLAPMIIADGRRHEGQHISLRVAFRHDGTKLETRDDLFYGSLEAPTSIYNMLRIPILRITEFQTFATTVLVDPARRSRFISGHSARTGESSLTMFGPVEGFLGTITLWNYDLAASDPSRLMTPTHAAWLLNAQAVAQRIRDGKDPIPPQNSEAWDINAHAFMSAVPELTGGVGRPGQCGIVRIPAAVTDRSRLVSLLLRRGSRRVQDATTDSGDLVIDRYYQTALPDSSDRITAPVYGKTEPPAGSVHSKHLRARDNQIPVMSARNLVDIAHIVEHLRQKDEIILYRGQTRHYEIQRPAREHHMLYGAADPGEVSLLTSASREFFPYDEFHGRFQLYLQGLLYEHVPTSAFVRAVTDETQRLNRPFDDKWIADIYRKWKAWYGESIWDLVAMGLAQHYGVPTHGLDLTDELEVALWFAVHQYYEHERRGQKRAWYRRLEGWEKTDSPVIYAIAVKADLKRHLDSAMRALLIPYPLRVGRQGAYLHYGGWGLQANACAEDVRLAIFLEPEFEIPELPDARYWFPGPDRDPFYRKILYAKAFHLGGDLFDRILDYEDPRDGVLYEAIMMERFDEAHALLKSGAGAHYRDPGDPQRGQLDPNRGLTALHWGAFYGRVELVATLLNLGADINAADINGRRPLVCAAMRGEAETVRHLLRRGAGAEALAYEGWRLIPPQRRPRAVLDVLREHGIDGTTL